MKLHAQQSNRSICIEGLNKNKIMVEILKARTHLSVASKASFLMRFIIYSVKHINALLRCSLVVTAVTLL